MKGVKMEFRTKDLYADLYENEGKPLVVIIDGSIGGMPKMSDKLFDFLKSQYNVLSLAYFGIGDLPKHLKHIPIEYFVNAIAKMKSLLKITEKDITLIGCSKGGEAVLLLISEFINPGVAIACVPSCYSWQGIPHGFFDILFPKPSWTFNNKDVPYIKFRYDKAVIGDLKKKKYVSCHEKSIEMNQNKKAIISVNKFQGKLLLLSSAHDEFWPSKEMCDYIQQNNNISVEHKEMNLEGHYFLNYIESGEAIIEFIERRNE